MTNIDANMQAIAEHELPKIHFEEVVRDCGYNRQAEENGDKLLKDLRVIIAGEYRAILSRCSPGERGYHIFDIDHRPLYLDEWRRASLQGQKVDSRAGAHKFIKDMLLNNRIPTMAQIEQKRAEEKEATQAKEAAEKEAKKLRIIQAAAPRLFADLKGWFPLIEGSFEGRSDEYDKAIDETRALINELESNIA